VNLNTASAEVIFASVPGLEMAQAQRLVNVRATAHFRTVADALKVTGVTIDPASIGQLSVASNFFEIQGRLRLGATTVQERSVVERQDLDVKVLWRERKVVNAATAFTTMARILPPAAP
jgi:general secretion pathway protein K